jgi:hypothetical protein
MKIRMFFLVAALFFLLNTSLVLSADKESAKQNVKDPMYYMEKGNRGEKISKEEFMILMSELEKKLTDFKVASSKISIARANFSYEIGKSWEIVLQKMNENIEEAFKYTNAVKNNPDSMSISLILYIFLRHIEMTALDFEKIKYFETTLNNTNIRLSHWCTAFEKSHLIPLAVAKDKHEGLYRIK